MMSREDETSALETSPDGLTQAYRQANGRAEGEDHHGRSSMTYLLSEEGRTAMRAVATRPILYAFDFDGTLAPISPDRNAVTIPYSTNEWLKELAKRAPCAVVSGRALTDLAPRVKETVPHVIGNHGIEGPLSQPASLLWADGICQGWKREISSHLAEALKQIDVEVEDKRYSLTFHYRQAAEPARVRKEVLSLVEQLSPSPRLIVGKSSINALPPGQGGKGAAALALMKHLRQSALFYVGDDETDEDVFTLPEGLSMGVRIGYDAESRANFYLKHQSEIDEVLRFLVPRIDRTPKSDESNQRKGNGAWEVANEV